MATPPEQTQRWYLHSGGGAHNRPSDGSLSPVAPTMEPVDSFNSGAPSPETLRYSSPAFVAPLAVRGPVVVELYAASSSADAEFTASLVDIAPDLTGVAIASATGRAAAGNGSIAIDLGELEHTFAIAHRLRIDFGAASGSGVAAQQVFHDAVRPSCVVVQTAPL
jgi:predicted acyl esterase